jgi:hypothetical protein
VLDGLRQAELASPLHLRPETIAHDLKSYLRDRKRELDREQRHMLELALSAIERAVGSIKACALDEQG